MLDTYYFLSYLQWNIIWQRPYIYCKELFMRAFPFIWYRKEHFKGSFSRKHFSNFKYCSELSGTATFAFQVTMLLGYYHAVHFSGVHCIWRWLKAPGISDSVMSGCTSTFSKLTEKRLCFWNNIMKGFVTHHQLSVLWACFPNVTYNTLWFILFSLLTEIFFWTLLIKMELFSTETQYHSFYLQSRASSLVLPFVSL